MIDICWEVRTLKGLSRVELCINEPFRKELKQVITFLIYDYSNRLRNHFLYYYFFFKVTFMAYLLGLTDVFTSVQVFLLQGRLIFGPDIRSIFLTIFLIATPVGIFCGFIGRKLMDEYSDGFGIWIIVVAVLFTIYVSPALFFSSCITSWKLFLLCIVDFYPVVADVLVNLQFYIVSSKC